MYILGDVHGKWDQLKTICEKHSGTTVLGLGDIGIGFPSGTPELPANFKFFRGNHDNPEVCRNHPACIGEGGSWNGIFYVPGAPSVDAEYRTPNINWWPDEQLDPESMKKLYQEWCDTKPTILVCHEAPWRLHKIQHQASILYDPNNAGWGSPRGNNTAFLLESMIKHSAPKLVIHGHWHNSMVLRQRGITYVSLGELEIVDFKNFL